MDTLGGQKNLLGGQLSTQLTRYLPPWTDTYVLWSCDVHVIPMWQWIRKRPRRTSYWAGKRFYVSQFTFFHTSHMTEGIRCREAMLTFLRTCLHFPGLSFIVCCGMYAAEDADYNHQYAEVTVHVAYLSKRRKQKWYLYRWWISIYEIMLRNKENRREWRDEKITIFGIYIALYEEHSAFT